MRKNAFTLVELLAVIVILAIIALIAVPIVLNIINDSKEESLKRSASHYLSAVTNTIAKENLKRKFNPYYCEGESGEELTCYDDKNNSLGQINIEVKNKVPKNIKLYFNNGKILYDNLELEIEGYIVSTDEKGNLVLTTSSKVTKKCVEYSDLLDGERLEQSEYVDYTGYTSYLGGMTIEQAYAYRNMTFTNATFDTAEKKWIVGNTGDGYGAYYIVQESGYYQIVLENGEMQFVMNAQDEKIVNKYLTRQETTYMMNKQGVVTSEITHLNAGEKIFILGSTSGSSFYIKKSNTNTLKTECVKWREKYNIGTEKITTSNDYRGYYADIDSDGYVDGVIYADLAHAESGEWGPYNNGQYANDGTYSYTAQTNLKEYTISSEKYNEKFGNKEVITLKKNSPGTERFYIMALEDFRIGSFEEDSGYNVGTYYWYQNAYDKMSTYATDTSVDFGAGYANTGNIINIWNKNGIGVGSYSGATQDDHDIFKHIQSEYAKGWYIPSRGEWGAFADYFGITSNCDTGTCVAYSGNYSSLYGLSVLYWSSSQGDTCNAWYVGFDYGYMSNINVFSDGYVRLGATF